jgi:hypothetical protein
MNIYYSLNELEINKINFHKPIPNKFSNYTNFYKIIYNTKIFTLNSLLLYLDVNYSLITFDIESDKYKLSLNYTDEFLLQLKQLEEEIIQRLNININKSVILSLYNTILHNNIIYVNDIKNKKIRLYIRISGLWESESHIGLTIKLSINSKTI